MDDNTRQVIVAIATIVGGLLTGVLVARLGFQHARRIETERWAREDRYRHRAEKVMAYSAFLAAMGDKIDGLLGDMNLARAGTERDEPYAAADPSVPLQTIVILSPQHVVGAAQKYYDYSVACGLNVLNRQIQNMGLDEGREVPDFDADEYNRLREAAEQAMHGDLA